jgi:RNA ligase (TIGR02306 family)
VFDKLDIFNKIKLGESVFGEIIGPGIQKGYEYGLKEHQFILFDVKVLNADGTQKWLSPSEVKTFAIERGLQFVPVVYEGPFNKELAYTLTKGPSLFCPKEKVREGIVIKASENYSVDGNKQALKWVSEDYLNDPSNTDDH